MSLKALANSKLGTTLVTGAFALGVAAVSGYFNWLSRMPPAAPQPAPPALAVATGGGMSLPQAPVHAPVTQPSLEDAHHASSPNLLLNFAQFQRKAKVPGLSTEARAEFAAPLVGRTVVWQGYVDQTLESSLYPGGGWTVVLCEDMAAVEQSMFKIPAHCRFDDDLTRVQQLRRGQRITVSGLFHQHTVLGTEIANARLINVTDN